MEYRDWGYVVAVGDAAVIVMSITVVRSVIPRGTRRIEEGVSWWAGRGAGVKVFCGHLGCVLVPARLEIDVVGL